MAVRGYPEDVFQTRQSVQTQEPVPVHVVYPAPAVQASEGTNNTTLVIFGIVALVGLLGLFALLGTNNNKRCDR